MYELKKCYVTKILYLNDCSLRWVRPKSENKLTNAEKKRCWRDKHGEEEKEKARIKYHET